MGTTKIKLGILAYENIPEEIISSSLKTFEEYHYLWLKEIKVFLYINASKWLNGNYFDKIVEEIHNPTMKPPEDYRFELISFETTTDIVCYFEGKLSYSNEKLRTRSYKIELGQKYERGSSLLELLYHLTIDFPIYEKEDMYKIPNTGIFNYQEVKNDFNKNDILLVCFVGFSEEELVYDDYKSEVLFNRNSCVYSINNGFPFSIRYYDKFSDFKNTIHEELPRLSTSNNVILFRYSPEQLNLIPYLLYSFEGESFYVRIDDVYNQDIERLDKLFKSK